MSDTYPKSADLTDQLVRRLPFTARGQVMIRDEDCKGLFLVIGMETKTFSAKVERMVGGIRECGYETFGRFDPRAPDHVGVKEARKAAGKWIADYRNGAKVAAKRGGTTLREAWARYKARLEAKGRSPRTSRTARSRTGSTPSSFSSPPRRWLPCTRTSPGRTAPPAPTGRCGPCAPSTTTPSARWTARCRRST
jgi:hypothetical protein